MRYIHVCFFQLLMKQHNKTIKKETQNQWRTCIKVKVYTKLQRAGSKQFDQTHLHKRISVPTLDNKNAHSYVNNGFYLTSQSWHRRFMPGVLFSKQSATHTCVCCVPREPYRSRFEYCIQTHPPFKLSLPLHFCEHSKQNSLYFYRRTHFNLKSSVYINNF